MRGLGCLLASSRRVLTRRSLCSGYQLVTCPCLICCLCCTKQHVQALVSLAHSRDKVTAWSTGNVLNHKLKHVCVHESRGKHVGHSLHVLKLLRHGVIRLIAVIVPALCATDKSR